jgi:rhodanese-related sulfurtransferase
LEFSDFDEMAATVLPDKDAKILVYCRSGNRSKTASEMLLDMGYTDVTDFGGYKDW